MKTGVYALIGSGADHSAYVIKILKERLCSGEHTECATCLLIEERKHYQTLWLEPEKQLYTRADFELFFQAISFERTSDPLFVIITKADRLSVSVSNNLLKVLEEPPFGVTIYLLADTKESLLETIASRCIILSVSHREQTKFEQLKKSFTTDKKVSLVEFSSYELPNEVESRQVIDELIIYWKETLGVSSSPHFSKIDFWMNARSTLPMSGSSKLFWRTQFLIWQSIK